jgi:hypothetical protein
VEELVVKLSDHERGLQRAMENDQKAWVGVDLDGTLAHWDGYVAYDSIGDPIPAMVQRVSRWLELGIRVKVVTARLHDHGERYCKLSSRWYGRPHVINAVHRWCVDNIGMAMEVTCSKDEHMIELWDDRAVQVITNTGRTLAEEHEAKLAALGGAP